QEAKQRCRRFDHAAARVVVGQCSERFDHLTFCDQHCFITVAVGAHLIERRRLGGVRIWSTRALHRARFRSTMLLVVKTSAGINSSETSAAVAVGVAPSGGTAGAQT